MVHHRFRLLVSVSDWIDGSDHNLQDVYGSNTSGWIWLVSQLVAAHQLIFLVVVTSCVNVGWQEWTSVQVQEATTRIITPTTTTTITTTSTLEEVEQEGQQVRVTPVLSKRQSTAVTSSLKRLPWHHLWPVSVSAPPVSTCRSTSASTSPAYRNRRRLRGPLPPLTRPGSCSYLN